MAIQPSLFQMEPAPFRAWVQQERGSVLQTCPRLSGDYLPPQAVLWNRFRTRSDDCCSLCAPRSEAPLRLGPMERAAILSGEQGAGRHLYLWATLHYDSTGSWTRAQAIEDSFWQAWATLTQRTVHLTVDLDGRGLCGYLSPAELPAFHRQLAALSPPDPAEGPDDIDWFDSQEEFESLRSLQAYAAECMEAQRALAWVHDFVY